MKGPVGCRRRTTGRRFLCCLLLSVGLAGCLAGRTEYVYDGRVDSRQVSAAVTVVRDTQGVPHIYAESAGDLFFGLGYTMAQDRLFQMDVYRHTAQGRLAEWFGNLRLGKGMRLVQVDMILKGFEIEANTRRAVDRMTSEDRLLLERFAAGINQLIADRASGAAVEYRLLRVQPESWSAADVACIPEIFGAGLAVISAGTEILYEAMRRAMGPELAEDFFQRYEKGELHSSPGAASRKAAAVADADGAEGRPLPPEGVGDAGFAGGEPSPALSAMAGSGADAASGGEAAPPPAGLFPARRGSEPGLSAGSALSLFGNLLAAGRLLMPGLPQGSNNWVVSGDRSAGGKPILANDPHVPLGIAPSFWYHAHLEGGGFSVAGLLYAGYPAVICGWNGRAAWGVTNVMADQVDLFREKIDPDSPDRFLTPDGWQEFDRKEVRCKVRLGRDRTFTLRKGRHGFLLPEEALRNRYSRNYPWLREPASLCYVETDPAAFWRGQLELMQAGASGEVKKALEKIGAGPTAFNYVWAIQDGDIGYHAAGVIPIRTDGQGLRPREGWKPEGEWQGTIPFDRLPARDNPPEGIIQTANERIADPQFPWYITADYARPYRSRRIRQLVAAGSPCSVEQFQGIQADVFNLPAGPIIEVLLGSIRGETAGQELEPSEREALGVLESWDRRNNPESAGAALFEVFYQTVLENTFADEAGAELTEILFTTNFLTAKVLDTLLDEPDSVWYDDRGTPARENRDSVFAVSFREAVRRCRNLMGERPAEWSWGSIHTLRLEHPLGRMPWWGKPYRIGKVPYPGDNDTVNGGYFMLDRLHGKVFAGAASRLVVDLARPDEAWFNCSTGVGGEPASVYFKNLSEGWLREAYFRTELTKEPGAVAKGRRLVIGP